MRSASGTRGLPGRMPATAKTRPTPWRTAFPQARPVRSRVDDRVIWAVIITLATVSAPMDRIPIPEPGSHLAVLFDAPSRQNGLCLLYLHGFGSVQTGEKAEFFRQRALESGFAFCSFDFQGHGQSGGTMRGLTLTRNLEDVARVHGYVRDRGYERIFLLGSSMGGGTALWYSALHPEEIIAGLHIAPALHLERGLTSWAGPERCRVWEETGTIHFENDLISCELGWELIGASGATGSRTSSSATARPPSSSRASSIPRSPGKK